MGADCSEQVILGSIGARYGNEDFANAVIKPFFAVCELFISTAETSIQPANAAVCLGFSLVFSYPSYPYFSENSPTLTRKSPYPPGD